MHAEALPYWGKARPLTHGADAKPYHLLTYHCLDVAAVGIEALKRLPALRTLFASRLGLQVDQLEPWIGFWLALHDLGKFAESFQSQCPDVCFLAPQLRTEVS